MSCIVVEIEYFSSVLHAVSMVEPHVLPEEPSAEI